MVTTNLLKISSIVLAALKAVSAVDGDLSYNGKAMTPPMGWV